MRIFLKKHWLIMLFLFVVPIVALVIAGRTIIFSEATVVSVICAAFTYFGTIVLALVTVMQNDKITELSTRNAEIEEIRLSNTYHPFLEVKSILDGKENELKGKSIYKNQFGPVKQIDNIKGDTVYIVLTNSGNASAFNATVYDFGAIEPKEEFGEVNFWGYKNVVYSEIEAGDVRYWQLHFEDNALLEISFNLCYQNEFGNDFYNRVMVVLIDADGDKSIQVGTQEQLKGKASMDLKERYYRTDLAHT